MVIEADEVESSPSNFLASYINPNESTQFYFVMFYVKVRH